MEPGPVEWGRWPGGVSEDAGVNRRILKPYRYRCRHRKVQYRQEKIRISSCHSCCCLARDGEKSRADAEEVGPLLVGAAGIDPGNGMIMKVAIAKEGNDVSEHFGHCSEYVVFTIENGKISSSTILQSPGHEPGRLPVFLAERGITHVLAGGMGPKAVELFCANNIEVYLGISGLIDTVIRDFLAGKISPGQSSCTHGSDHVCTH